MNPSMQVEHMFAVMGQSAQLKSPHLEHDELLITLNPGMHFEHVSGVD